MPLDPKKVRKIEKWYPFAALSDPIADQYRLDRINNLKTQPELSDDQIEEINEVMAAVIIGTTEVELNFFVDGTIEQKSGVIQKIDHINKVIVMLNVEIEFNQFITIDILEK